MSVGTMEKPLVSIIIPTFNEEEDIRKTLEACVALEYSKKEIVVVDDSKDSTPIIVKEYADQNVRLIKRSKNDGGRCGARNLGILESKGEIIIILNADVILPKDFIEKILKHYENGAGVVLVESKVINQNYLFPRFLGSYHFYFYSDPRNDKTNYWTEGYSCLKEAALRAGLFPITPISLYAGEDGYFGKKIEDLGYKKIIDRSILVTHFAPYKFKDYWRIMKERVSAPASYFLEKRSLISIFIRSVGRSIITILTIILVVPTLTIAWRVSNFSPRKKKDLIPFAYAYIIQQIAFLLGKWTSLFKLISYKLRN